MKFKITPLYKLGMFLLLATIWVGSGSVFAQGRQWTAEEKEDLAYLDKHTEPGATYRLSLGHPNQYRHVMNALKRAGITPENAPQLHKVIEQTRQSASQDAPALPFVELGIPQPINIIESFEQVNERTYAATCLSSVYGGTDASLILADLYHETDDNVYASKFDIQYGQGTYFKVSVQGTEPDSNTDTTSNAMCTFVYVPKGEMMGVYFVKQSQDTTATTLGCMEQPNYCKRDGVGYCISGQYHTECSNKEKNPAPIEVCYYRGSQKKCDYWNPEGHPKNFVFPLQGYIDFGKKVAKLPLSKRPIGNVTIDLVNPIKGGGCPMLFEKDKSLDKKYWSVSDENRRRLNFNYPAAAFPDPEQCLNLYGGTSMNFNMEVSVLLHRESGVPIPVRADATFTSDRTQAGKPGVYLVPPIHIQQGCLAAGTDILMANGSLKAIETFKADGGEMVETGAGQPREVLGSSHGIEPKPMVLLQTEVGQELMLTETHPVMTPEGPVMAMDPKVGQMVRTSGEPVKLSNIERVPYQGKVYNLRLGKLRNPEGSQSDMYANGILVDDSEMQRHLEKMELEKLANDSSHVLHRLPPEWHEDYRRQMQQKAER
ncbi:MAG: hypothetical protein ETSY2_41675 [Candidatus Entotheonella gemina]|uniref:Hint domain-containing protein n=1 Tax=Candidatus Entotheonella gemina TaxID=1429439 RepID=W4LMA0_9BACT|nr:MAG: hypothetical protein ETSY2_41675 [Candidatus Entotheonella gemina]